LPAGFAPPVATLRRPSGAELLHRLFAIAVLELVNQDRPVNRPGFGGKGAVKDTVVAQPLSIGSRNEPGFQDQPTIGLAFAIGWILRHRLHELIQLRFAWPCSQVKGDYTWNGGEYLWAIGGD